MIFRFYVNLRGCSFGTISPIYFPGRKVRAEKTEKREKRRPASAGAARDARDGWGALRERSLLGRKQVELDRTS